MSHSIEALKHYKNTQSPVIMTGVLFYDFWIKKSSGLC